MFLVQVQVGIQGIQLVRKCFLSQLRATTRVESLLEPSIHTLTLIHRLLFTLYKGLTRYSSYSEIIPYRKLGQQRLLVNIQRESRTSYSDARLYHVEVWYYNLIVQLIYISHPSYSQLKGVVQPQVPGLTEIVVLGLELALARQRQIRSRKQRRSQTPPPALPLKHLVEVLFQLLVRSI